MTIFALEQFSANDKPVEAAENHKPPTIISTIPKTVFIHYMFARGIVRVHLGFQITHHDHNAIFRQRLRLLSFIYG